MPVSITVTLDCVCTVRSGSTCSIGLIVNLSVCILIVLSMYSIRRIYREHVCNLIVLAVYSICLCRDPDCMLIVLSVYSLRNRDHIWSLYSRVVGSRLENFHLVVNDNFLQDEGEECQDPSGPIRGTAVF